MDKLTKSEEKLLTALYERQDRDDVSTEELVAATGLGRGEVIEALAALKEKKMIGDGPQSLADAAGDFLREMDETFTPTKPGFAEHAILAASLLTKADEKFLAEELGYDSEFVSIVGARLRASGVWKNDAINETHKKIWMEEDGVGFLLCGAIATGDLMIVGHGPDGFKYQMTEGGKTSAAKLIKKMTR